MTIPVEDTVRFNLQVKEILAEMLKNDLDVNLIVTVFSHDSSYSRKAIFSAIRKFITIQGAERKAKDDHHGGCSETCPEGSEPTNEVQ